MSEEKDLTTDGKGNVHTGDFLWGFAEIIER